MGALFVAQPTGLTVAALGDATYPLTSVPALRSRPGASVQVYLDFDGEPSNANWAGRTIPATPAYDQDGDPNTFSAGELASIEEIWARVSEKYSPFNLSVTTIDPGNMNARQTLRVVLGGNGSWNGGGGGTAIVGGFDSTTTNTAYVFEDNLSNGSPKMTAEAASHEIGHTFGLRHQSTYSGTSKTTEYNSGNTLTAPIMGASYSSIRGLWWLGPNASSSTSIQDDLAVIANSYNGFGYRADDFGGGWADRSGFTTSGVSLSAAGVIERTSDVDSFGFTTDAGTVSFTAAVAQFGPMLDLSIAVQDGAGNVLASSATSSLDESVSVNLAAGTYRLVVYSAGNYGDIGQYTISGTLPASSNTPAPVANAGGPYAVKEGGSIGLSGAGSTGMGLTYAWDLDGDGIYGETGAGATRGGETGATPTFSAIGLDGAATRTVSLRVTDGEGRTSTDAATISIANVAPTLTLGGLSSVNEGATYTLTLTKSDPGLDTISSWTINWGDGTSQTIAGNLSSVTHVYADNGARTITASATDEDGTYSAGSKSVTVTNAAPTVTISGNASVFRGDPYTLNLSSSDVGADTISQWVINWGDGNTQVVAGDPSTASHTYTTSAEYTITATATDEDGSYAAAPLPVSVYVKVIATPHAELAPLSPVIVAGDGSYVFSLTYYDDDAIARSSLLDGLDILVTGPGGFQQLAQAVQISHDVDQAPMTVTYRIAVSGGKWTDAHNGEYAIAVQANQVFNTKGTAVPATTMGSFSVAVPAGDTSNPRATVSAPSVTAAGDGTYTFAVTYHDNYAISRATLDNHDVIVFGPGGLELLAKVVKISHAWDRAPMTVHYRITVPGGAWTMNYNGSYAISVRARQVYDTGGNSVPAGAIGAFEVAVPAPDYAGNTRETARYLGLFSPGRVRVAQDWVSEADIQDYYQFRVTTYSSISLRVSELTSDVSLQVRALNHRLMAVSARSGTQQESLTLTLPPGTYYARIISADAVETPYRLRVAAQATTSALRTTSALSAGAFNVVSRIKPASASLAWLLGGSSELDDLIVTR